MPRLRTPILLASTFLALCAWALVAQRAACAGSSEGTLPDQPAYGGRVIVHLFGMPRNSLNYAIDNSSYGRRMLYEVHEYLLAPDWETTRYEPVLCTSWDEEDMLVLRDEARAKYPEATPLSVRVDSSSTDPAAPTKEIRVLYGSLEPSESGWKITPLSPGNPLGEPRVVPASDVERVEQRTVFTFHLREGVAWQPSLLFRDREDLTPEKKRMLDAQRLDARDVYFSWSLYSNPEVACGDKRFQVAKMPRCDVVDPLTVRIFYEAQYFKALDAIGTTLTILPSHVYDLSDPDNPDYDPEASVSKQAKHINENPHNRMWVGLGPYQVQVYDEQGVEARRFEGYFDPSRSGYIDVIRWRYISSDDTAFQALLNGELDFTDRILSENYLGEATAQEAFTRAFDKGHYFLGVYTYTSWNLRRPQFADPAVRKAFALAFDSGEFLQGFYKGLGRAITGPFPYDSPAYNRSVEPLPYDPAAARELLEEAGWYDRNGNGIRDRDGVELEFTYLLNAGNAAMQAMSQKLQESLAAVGARMHIEQVDWGALQERLKYRDFDATSLAWAPPLESDPEMIWHSRGAAVGSTSSNWAGLADTDVDALIARGQREADFDKRQAIWRELHARLYALQPYMWHYNVPIKYAISKRLHGFQPFVIDPGYSIRRWYYSLGEPGTRATLRE
jgi:peptide/nickel transport system substrate-binding protein